MYATTALTSSSDGLMLHSYPCQSPSSGGLDSSAPHSLRLKLVLDFILLVVKVQASALLLLTAEKIYRYRKQTIDRRYSATTAYIPRRCSSTAR